MGSRHDDIVRKIDDFEDSVDLEREPDPVKDISELNVNGFMYLPYTEDMGMDGIQVTSPAVIASHGPIDDVWGHMVCSVRLHYADLRHYNARRDIQRAGKELAEYRVQTYFVITRNPIEDPTWDDLRENNAYREDANFAVTEVPDVMAEPEERKRRMLSFILFHTNISSLNSVRNTDFYVEGGFPQQIFQYAARVICADSMMRFWDHG